MYGGIGALRASNCERQLPYREERHFQHPTDGKQDIVFTHTRDRDPRKKEKEKESSPFTKAPRDYVQRKRSLQVWQTVLKKNRPLFFCSSNRQKLGLGESQPSRLTESGVGEVGRDRRVRSQGKTQSPFELTNVEQGGCQASVQEDTSSTSRTSAAGREKE